MTWVLAGTSTAAAALSAVTYYFSDRVLRVRVHPCEAVLEAGSRAKGVRVPIPGFDIRSA